MCKFTVNTSILLTHFFPFMSNEVIVKKERLQRIKHQNSTIRHDSKPLGNTSSIYCTCNLMSENSVKRNWAYKKKSQKYASENVEEEGMEEEEKLIQPK